MKRLSYIFILMLLCVAVKAQNILYFDCQVVLRNSDQSIISNQKATVQVKVLQGSADGPVVYTETHKGKTDSEGVLKFTVGKGKTADDFQKIEWNKTSYFAQFETSVSGTATMTNAPILLYEPQSNGEKILLKDSDNQEYISADSTDENRQKHDYVDLGLPSGTLWATTNIGAVNPQDYGWFFGWGETAPKEKFDQLTYRRYPFGHSDNNNSFGLTDDAAAINWGRPWVVPTIEQFIELCKECYWVWTDGYNGTKVAGFIVYKAKNENDKGVKIYKDGSASILYTANDSHIFLPAAGYMKDSWVYNDGEGGCYWSSSFSNSHAVVHDLHFNSGYVNDKNIVTPIIGHSIRPVRSGKK